ncbi:S41 family peptidase [Flavobacterium procerum]|uniref:S41 family peptidase n=1 Tax=Flavobacterium procerum TaxID=1455569 RepID=A0ABV6BKT6_9FLAO
MKTPLKSFLFLFILVFSLQSCEDKNDNAAPADVQINDFIWKGLNEVYLWQQDVPNLADNRFTSQNDLNSFLRGYAKPEDLFEDLLYRPESKFPTGAVDRFSWIVSDYTVLEQELGGISKNNGVDFRLGRISSSSDDVVGYVRYIIPNSDASTKAIKRGDLFTSVNGTKLTVANYQQLLINQDSYTLNMADKSGNNYVLNGKSVSLTKTILEENPIFINKIIESGTHKIGYLMYNGFYADYDERLNNAFGELKAKGATDFILDLRYNGGGSVRTSTRLATMITSNFPNQVFSKRQYNAKLMSLFNPESLNERFVADIDGKAVNSLNFGTIYIITTASTASASELIINGLKPYMNVVQIGETTTGKNVGSFTVYDSDTYITKEGINRNHKYAMQPLVFKIANAQGFGDYQNGLEPTYKQLETVSTYGVLGDPKEPLLSLAISKITGSPAKRVPDVSDEPISPYLTDSKILNGFRHGMYLTTTPKEFLNLK